MLKPQTAAALNLSGHPIVWAQLPKGDLGAYGRFFRSLWSWGHTFIICEQDIVPTPEQLETITSCGHPWCSFSYDDGLYPDGPMFGLVRFDSVVMRAHPMAANADLIIGKRKDVEAEWWRVDSLVARGLGIRGVPWYQHGPPVRHVHAGPPSGPP